ncbi:MAG: hypothetical protein MPJ50_00140 [Pirellulales bacterium]|nr:hypothetical protein [Pirellulales bacterium]
MFNRNHIFMIGALLLFLGIQFRMVESVVLNEKTTQFLAQKFGDPAQKTAVSMPTFFGGSSQAQKVIEPPNWVGWIMLSAGVVLVLHSLAMPKPGT